MRIAFFDIDNTLTESRRQVSFNISELLSELSKNTFVAMISGGSFDDMEKQVFSVMPKASMENLFALPMEGAEMRRYENGAWHVVYSHSMDAEKRKRVMEEIIKLANLKEEGRSEFLEDRGGAVSYHALGKNAPIEEKYAWDPKGEKRRKIICKLSSSLNNVFMSVAGSTSINITDKGIDKSFGINKMISYLGIDHRQAVFVGDSFGKNGNDAPVKKTKVRVIKTAGPKNTEEIISNLVKQSASQKPPLHVAYFCMEYAVEEDLPLFAGGLGILSSDMLSGVSRRGDVIFSAIGLLNRKGMKSVTNKGETDYTGELSRRGYEKVMKDGEILEVDVPVSDKNIKACAWVKKFGRSALYLLDTNVPENEESDRHITDFLYDEDPKYKIAQEMVLGIGGVRLIKALAAKVDVWHMNEGHTGFGALALYVENDGLPKVVATKHTILSGAGSYLTKYEFDRLLFRYVSSFNKNLEEIFEKGLSKDGDFSLTKFLLFASTKANAVSLAHAKSEKKKHLNSPLFAVTNGVDLYRWSVSPLNKYPALSDEEIWRAKGDHRAELVYFINGTYGSNLDPNIMTVVWARRFVTYKRPGLVLSRPEKIIELINSDKPVQFIFAGKSFENDSEGMRAANLIKEMSVDPRFKKRVVYIPDYSVAIAKKLVAGADVWLNTPVPGYEACGTSGMKAALSGALVMSTDDGWVSERREVKKFGFIIQERNVEAKTYKSMYDASRLFYSDRNRPGLSGKWISRMKGTMSLAAGTFDIQRMIADYITKSYN